MNDYNYDEQARRRALFRLLQLFFLLLMGVCFLLAALAQSLFASALPGWWALGGMVICFIAFWWFGHEADRRS
ncbi:hypothetical protein GALL_87480 [mine drainage metagenome]|uniref:Uncharacterized protein n=1 Tax=mine drainage metagenome TaxID=410659 RepID=A0A1J5SYS2_9ZZZZ